MDGTQIYSLSENEKEVIDVPDSHRGLTFLQRSYVDYKAMNGLITTDDGIRKMPVEELAGLLGVSRRMVYKARDGVPDFWYRVNERRKELSGKERLAKVHETWYLKAVKGDFQHMQLWLANHDPEFRMPTEKVQHELGDGYADIIQSLMKEGIIDGEVVNREIDERASSSTAQNTTASA
jgi:hypothetical protein